VQDAKELTVQHLHLLMTQHLVDCSLEGQPGEIGLEKRAIKCQTKQDHCKQETKPDSDRAKRLHLAMTSKGPKQNYNCKEQRGDEQQQMQPGWGSTEL